MLMVEIDCVNCSPALSSFIYGYYNEVLRLKNHSSWGVKPNWLYFCTYIYKVNFLWHLSQLWFAVFKVMCWWISDWESILVMAPNRQRYNEVLRLKNHSSWGVKPNWLYLCTYIYKVNFLWHLSQLWFAVFIQPYYPWCIAYSSWSCLQNSLDHGCMQSHTSCTLFSCDLDGLPVTGNFTESC